MDLPIASRIAVRVRELRESSQYSLESLAEKSGVSRSMISVIERGESNPTAVVLDKLASALGVSLSSLFEDQAVPGSPVSREEDQPEWKDPASGYVRRNVSPPGVVQPMRVSEIRFPPGASVAFDNVAYASDVYEQVWILEGTMEISHGSDRYRLRKGDCLAIRLEGPTTFHNPSRKTARYAVVIAEGRNLAV